MPTQRTKQITFTREQQDLIRICALGMHVANSTCEYAGHESCYGGFYDALQRVMEHVFGYDPDLMEVWESNAIQTGLDISDSWSYPKQIKYALESVAVIKVIIE